MPKILRLTESELVRLVNKVLKEQFSGEMISRDFSEPEDTSFDYEKRNNEITKAQLKDIVMNFNKIDCDGISHFNELDLYGKRPERDIIYCLYYRGESRADIMKRYKSL